MKKIPASYQLDEYDIKAAITDWINKQREDEGDDETDFDIELNMTTERKVQGIGGSINDWLEIKKFSAIAKCGE